MAADPNPVEELFAAAIAAADPAAREAVLAA